MGEMGLELDKIFPSYELARTSKGLTLLTRAGLQLWWTLLDKPSNDEVIMTTILQEMCLRYPLHKLFRTRIELYEKYPEISEKLKAKIRYSEKNVSKFHRRIPYQRVEPYLVKYLN